VVIILAGGIFLFSSQIIELTRDFSDIEEKVLRIFAEITLYINNNVNLVPNLEKGELMKEIKDWIDRSTGAIIQKTFSSTASFIAGLLATAIFTFLMLIYRTGLVKAFVLFYPDERREQVLMMFKSMQQVGKKYLVGMILIIIVVGLINSIGLVIIGIDHPFLFGFMASLLAIIPYVGTTVGAAIPVLYAFMAYDSIWVAIAVAILFWAVQVVESNFLTPKIVGGSLKVNALTAIISIIVGASVWGIAGMVLFLPFVAMLRVFCEQYESLKPIAMLIGEQNDGEKDVEPNLINRWFSRI
jgi:predicted PurR-regulated permease PerM